MTKSIPLYTCGIIGDGKFDCRLRKGPFSLGVYEYFSVSIYAICTDHLAEPGGDAKVHEKRTCRKGAEK